MSDTFFKNRKVILERLSPFGFVRRKNMYSYSTGLVDGQFELLVTVAKSGAVTADILDAESGESYVLHRVSGARGEIVGRVREESGKALAAIADTCFEPDVFKSEGAKMVIRHVRKKYGDELEFLWKRSPTNAIYRRRNTGKWYAALLTVQKAKLGLPGDDRIEVLDLRGRPENMDTLVDGKKYFPGYHMNKKHWFTICFDGSVPQKEIHARIEESYSLAVR